MSNAGGFEEDLPRLAAESFDLSSRLCRSCGDMHALGPYIRLARGRVDVEPPSSPLQPQLTDLIARGRKKVLIAGAQDTGLLALVARAGARLDPEIVVLDRCATPLEMCRRFARLWVLPIETVQEDLTNLAMRERFDIVLVHFTLHFIPNDRHADVIARLRHALRPLGRLLLLFHTSHRVEADLGSENSERFADWAIDELERIPVSLPQAREAFRARLRASAQNIDDRQGAFREPEDFDALLASAGFAVRKRFEIGIETWLERANPRQDLIAKIIMKRRFLVIAQPTVNS
jgi:SAM-dependent methyltransferase